MVPFPRVYRELRGVWDTASVQQRPRRMASERGVQQAAAGMAVSEASSPQLHAAAAAAGVASSGGARGTAEEPPPAPQDPSEEGGVGGGSVLIRIHVPELNVNKCLQFARDELVWNVKQQVLAALPKVRDSSSGTSVGLKLKVTLFVLIV